jgi:beta-lactamase regulating signal transducer with metallopeptidase domain
MSDMGLRMAAWLLTYALHSTVLLCAAALLTARVVRGEAWRETLWKAALLGGIVTASLQSAGWMTGDLGGRELFVLRAAPATTGPSAPSIASVASTPSSPSDPSDPSAASTPSAPSVPSALSTAEGASTASVPAETAPRIASPALTAPASPTTARAADGVSSHSTSVPAAGPIDASPVSKSPPAPLSGRTLLEWAMLAWAAGAAAMLARLAWRQLRLRRLLRDRETVSDHAVLAMLAELRRNAGIWRPVRLTACPATPTPLALGGGEICVPPRFLTGLDPEQQRSALAHELAHLARRDPAWHFAIGILESVFFFQPLNRMARARLRDSAEFLCDAWAARQTGSPLGMARCLAEVASWVAPGRHPIPAGTMAMAEGGSPLVQRVQRLTSWRGEPREGSGIVRLAAAALLVAAVAAIAPAVASTRAAGPESASTGLAEQKADGQEPVIIRHPDASQPLARRWEWGVEQMGRRGMARAWIAYSVPTRMAADQGWWVETGGLALSSMDRAPLNAVLNAPEDHAVLLFAVTRDGELERVSGRHGVGMDLGGRTVMWLGAADGAESFAQLRRTADGLRDPDLRENLVRMIGIHPGSQAVPYLAAVLGRDGSNGVRQEAAAALALHATDESLDALRTAVRRDGSDDVRREAVEAIGEHGTAPAAALLRELATGHRDPGIRRTAAEALGRHPHPSRVETLRAVVFGDRDADVAREAVETLQKFDPALSGPLLERIAWTHPATDVARQAAESLGGLPARSGVARLDSIARRHPNPAVAQQAVESLGGYPESVTGGYLRAIARTHPAPRVREEARDQLSMVITGRRIGADTHPAAAADADADAHVDAEADADAFAAADADIQARTDAADADIQAHTDAADTDLQARAETADADIQARAEAAAKLDFDVQVDPADLDAIRAVRALETSSPTAPATATRRP